MTNRLWVLFLTTILLFVLFAGCDATISQPTADPSTELTTESPEEPTADSTEPPTNEPTMVPTEPPTEPHTEPPTEPPTEPLNLEEQFQTTLSYDGDYWLWRILGCTFENPQDISLKYLFYNGLRQDERENRDDYSDSEVAFLRDFAKDSFWGDEEAWVNALKIPGESLSAVLKDYLGLTMEDVTVPEDWKYFEETDAYYSIRTDGFGVSGHTVTEVIVLEDRTVQVYWTVGLLKNTLTGEYMENPEMVLTLQQQEDGSYRVLSNQPK